MELVQTKLWLPVALAILMLAVNSQQASAKPNKKNNQPPGLQKKDYSGVPTAAPADGEDPAWPQDQPDDPKLSRAEQQALKKQERQEQRRLAQEQRKREMEEERQKKQDEKAEKRQSSNIKLTNAQCNAAVTQCALVDPSNPENGAVRSQTSALNDAKKARKAKNQYRAVLNRLKKDVVTLINAVIADPEMASLPSICVELNDEASGSGTGEDSTPHAGSSGSSTQYPGPAGASTVSPGPNGSPTGNQGPGATSPAQPPTPSLAPVCTVGEWSEWSNLLGFGQQDRIREIIQPGVNCPYELSQWRKVSGTSDGNGDNDFDQVDLVEENFKNDFIRPSEGKPRDILLVLDSSSSINDTDFEVMKAGVKLLIDSLCGGFGMSDTNNRLSIIQFSTDRVGVHAFNHDQDPEELKRVVDSLEPLYGVTCTGWALDLAYTAFSAKYGARDFAEHDTLLITDGQSNCDEDLVWESNELQQRSNVYALGIGIGNNPDAASEIQSIVSNQDPRHLFSLANFQDFEVMVRNVQAASDKCQEIVVKK